jgi:hypothetical protein
LKRRFGKMVKEDLESSRKQRSCCFFLHVFI